MLQCRLGSMPSFAGERWFLLPACLSSLKAVIGNIINIHFTTNSAPNSHPNVAEISLSAHKRECLSWVGCVTVTSGHKPPSLEGRAKSCFLTSHLYILSRLWVRISDGDCSMTVDTGTRTAAWTKARETSLLKCIRSSCCFTAFVQWVKSGSVLSRTSIVTSVQDRASQYGN